MTTAAEPATATQVYAVFIRATPEQVWDGITKPEFTARYFYGSVMESTWETGATLDGWTGDHWKLVANMDLWLSIWNTMIVGVAASTLGILRRGRGDSPALPTFGDIRRRERFRAPRLHVALSTVRLPRKGCGDAPDFSALGDIRRRD